MKMQFGVGHPIEVHSCALNVESAFLQCPVSHNFPLGWGRNCEAVTLVVASTRLRLMVNHSHSQAVSWVVLQVFGSLGRFGKEGSQETA